MGYESARGAKRSPVHCRLEDKTKAWRDVSGWEGAMYYADFEPEFGWGEENYHGVWGEEHSACREGVAMVDMSFMSKFLVQGPEAGDFLNSLSTADVDGPVDTITYTQWLDGRGMMQADLTVTKLDASTFMVVATDTQHRHVLTHMLSRLPSDARCEVTDVTGSQAYLNLQGPKSRELLQALTKADLSDESFPFRASKEIDVGYAKVRCTRITYVGELGYELYVPAEQAVHVFDRLMEEVRMGEKRKMNRPGLARRCTNN